MYSIVSAGNEYSLYFRNPHPSNTSIKLLLLIQPTFLIKQQGIKILTFGNKHVRVINTGLRQKSSFKYLLRFYDQIRNCVTFYHLAHHLASSRYI